jgi:hypothetical protein
LQHVLGAPKVAENDSAGIGLGSLGRPGAAVLVVRAKLPLDVLLELCLAGVEDLENGADR